jgi:hypothetical protein
MANQQIHVVCCHEMTESGTYSVQLRVAYPEINRAQAEVEQLSERSDDGTVYFVYSVTLETGGEQGAPTPGAT